MSQILLPLAIIAFLIVLNGLFVAAEFAIVAVPRTRIAQAAEQGSRSARHVFSILNSPKRQNLYLATAQVGITVASLGLGMYGEHVVADWFLIGLERLGRLAEPLAHTLATILAIGLLTYLHVVVGEMVPKSLAISHAEPTALRLDAPMRVIQRLTSPLILALNAVGNGIVRLLGIPPADAHARLFSAQELEYVVEESAERGLMDPEDRLYIENIFDLRERTIGQVMTPRNHIVGIPLDADEEDVLARVCDGRHSRYPVYGHSLDDIVGILHVKSVARHQARVAEEGAFDLEQLVRPVIYVPESLPLDQMLVRFRRQRNPIAVVVDEFGGTAGLVTLEDVVEEVVGEILDEFDEEVPPLVELAPGQVRVRGDLLVDELNQLCGLSLAHPESDTVGGLVMSQLGRLAKVNDTVQVGGVSLKVEEVVGLAVQTVLVQFSPGDAGHHP